MKYPKYKNMKVSSIGKMIDGEQFVQCKKSIKTFIKGQSYILTGTYGDPQGAHAAGHEYMIMEFVNIITVKDKHYNNFEWKGRNLNMAKIGNLGFFQDYFVIDLREERKLKLEKINVN